MRSLLYYQLNKIDTLLVCKMSKEASLQCNPSRTINLTKPTPYWCVKLVSNLSSKTIPLVLSNQQN